MNGVNLFPTLDLIQEVFFNYYFIILTTLFCVKYRSIKHINLVNFHFITAVICKTATSFYEFSIDVFAFQP